MTELADILIRGKTLLASGALARTLPLASPRANPARRALHGSRTIKENAMLYRKETTKPVDQVFADIEAASTAHGFGVLHHYDFKKTLAGKGFPLDNECRVMEICNPRQASEVLAVDMALNMALPCRISIYQDGGKTIVGMIPPTSLLKLVSDDPRIAPAAREVEQAMQKIIEAAI